MAKKQTYHCGIITAEQIFNSQKTQYNGFSCGHGPHKNKKKYNRKDKSWQKDMGLI